MNASYAINMNKYFAQIAGFLSILKHVAVKRQRNWHRSITCTINVIIFWVTMPYDPVGGYQSVRGSYRHLHDRDGPSSEIYN
jgi:hypothetical protein